MLATSVIGGYERLRKVLEKNSYFSKKNFEVPRCLSVRYVCFSCVVGIMPDPAAIRCLPIIYVQFKPYSLMCNNAVNTFASKSSFCLMAKGKKTSPQEWLKIVSARLKDLRIEKGYTSYETFALEHGLDRKQYWRIENGSNITLMTLIKILELHEEDLSSFFRDLEKK
jgi:hypothetical protein